MFVWYVDKELKIEFDKKPIVAMCYPNPCYSDEKNRIIDDKPFLNKVDLNVRITYIEDEYNFKIENIDFIKTFIMMKLKKETNAKISNLVLLYRRL